MDAARARTSSEEKLYDDEKRPATSNVEAGPGIHVETQDVYDGAESGVDPVYQAKARILNDAFQEIGMGRYQVCTVTHLPSSVTRAEIGCSGTCS